MTEQPRLSLERLYASPSLNGPTAKGVKFSPDGARVTFQKGREDDASQFDLWQFDVATGEQSLLVDSKLLEPEEVELSEEEKALRERKRIAGQRGIVSYDWGTADTILIPIGGDLWLITLPESADYLGWTFALKPSAQSNGISLEDVRDAVSEYHSYEDGAVQRLPRTASEAGDAGTQEELLSTSESRFLDGLRSRPVTTADGSELTLGDIADFAYGVPPVRPDVRRLTTTEAFEYDARVSPKGNYVSFVRDGAVFTINLATGEETQITPDAEPGNAISYGVAEFVAQEEMSRYTGYWWSPDETYVAYTRVDESTVDVIERFDIAAEETTVIDQRYPRAGRPNAIVDLFVRNIETGETVQINWRRDDWGPATDQYLARVNWGKTPNGSLLAAQRVDRDQTVIDVPMWVLSGAEAQLFDGTFYSEEQSNWVNISSDTRISFPLLTTTSERSGYRQIVSFNLGHGDVIDPITSGEWVVSKIEGADDQSGLIFFTGFKDTPLEKHLYMVPASGGEPIRITEPGKTWDITMSPDGKSFVGTSSSPTQPPQTGLYRVPETYTDEELSALGWARLPDTNCIDTTPQAARIERKICPETELIAWIEENRLDESHPYFPYLSNHTVPTYGELTAEDGQTLYYSVQLPPDFDETKQYPAIVEVYGGPHVQTVTRNWERMTDQFYTQEGYVVFRLDNRGSWNRGKAFEDVIYRQTGGPEVRDQLLGVDWLKSQDYIDPDRVAIQGWSYGGYMTLMTLLQAAPDTFAAAVSGAPVTDWSLYDTFYTERYMDTPEDNPDGYEKSSVFYHLDAWEGELPPLLLVHGMADDNVTFDNTTRLMAELQERGLMFELMTYPGQRHGIRGQALQTHLMRTRMAFLNRHLKE